ncbi:hypothetical protein I4U23_011598 [Adineta vaga]|nr:hypothetical protein I4U23_011598 [Adineta vaga]
MTQVSDTGTFDDVALEQNLKTRSNCIAIKEQKELTNNEMQLSVSTETKQRSHSFYYATVLDWFYIFVATIVSVIHGVTLPVLLIVLGNVTNSFTNRSTNICMLNFTSLSQLYCPSHVILDHSNIEELYPLCNLTGINIGKSSSELSSQIGQQSAYIAIMGCIVLLFGYIQATFWTLTSERQAFQMRQTVFRCLMKKDIDYFDVHNVGHMNTVLMQNINEVKDGIGPHLGSFVQCIATFIGGFIIGLIKSWKLSLVLLSFSPILIICLIILTKAMLKMTSLELSTYAKAGAIAQEVLSSMRMVFAYNGADHEYHRYTQHLRAAKRSSIRRGIIFGSIMGFIRFIIFIIYAVGFIYGTRLIAQENSNIGDIFTVFFAIFIAVFSLAQATNTLRYQKYKPLKIKKFKSRELSDNKPTICGNIAFHNVSFTYASRPNMQVLSNVTFEALCGETIAVLGANGSGKSTCLQLLQGFYKPTNGTITIDRIPLNEMSTIRYATRILVMQNGRIVEQGNHEKLMELHGIYYNMVNDYEQRCQMQDSIETSSLNIHENDTDQLSVIADDETTSSHTDHQLPSSFLYMIKMNRPEWLYILSGCLVSFCIGGFQPATGILVSKIISVFQICSTDEQQRLIQVYVLLFVAFAILIWISVFLQNFLFACSGEALTERIRSKIFRNYLNQDIAWFDDPTRNSGSLCLQLASEASAVQKTTGVHMGTILEVVGNLGVGTILSFVYGWELTFVIIGFLPFIILAGIVNVKLVYKFSKNDSKVFKKASQVSMEAFRYVRTVRQLNKETYFIDYYHTLLLKPHQLACKRAHITGLLFSFSNAIVFFAQAALTAFAVFLITKNRRTFEDVLIVFNCILLGAQAAGQTVTMSSDYGKALRASKNILTLLERKSSIDRNSHEGLKLMNFQGNIRLNINSFTYPARPNISVLNNLYMDIQAGQSVALIGKNGSGKSSIMQILQRFYDIYDGQLVSIKLLQLRTNAKHLRCLNLQWYRTQIGYLSQVPVLFDMTIADNIAYGDLSRSVSLDEIIQAAKDAHAHSWIEGLPKKYNTMAGLNGEHLSGGQRQSVALARLLIRNPRILLLDECTSAMDNANEKAVEVTLSQIKQNRTSIVIGHRLSAICNADIIYVLHHQGYIVESGTHETLMAARGYYYKFHALET